jgi:hypothetical protein
MFGLNHEDGGVLEFLLFLVGDEPGFGSYVANAALSFWISCHSSTIKASFASFDSCFKSGSFSIPLSNVYLLFLSRGLSNYINVTNILSDSLTKETGLVAVSFTDNLVELDTIRETSEVRATGESNSLPNYYRSSCRRKLQRFLDLPQLTIASIWFPLIAYWLQHFA